YPNQEKQTIVFRRPDNRISHQVKIFENLAVSNYNSQSLTRTKPGPIKKARSYEAKRSTEIRPRVNINLETGKFLAVDRNFSKSDTKTS
ncbi:hypothetical protein, partial [Salmonella sp. s51228]|uniref:hypothetical protein n=1 Tax=Salmonella sp. s51228 TaxID=3159652 RepID=UPI003980BCC4